jgi:hypothetical protein
VFEPGGQLGPYGQPGPGGRGRQRQIEKMMLGWGGRKKDDPYENLTGALPMDTGNKLYDEYAKRYNEALLANEERYQDILGGYGEREGLVDKQFAGQRRMIEEAARGKQSAIQQQMIGSGLAQTTAGLAPKAIADRERQFALNDLANAQAMAQAQLQADTLQFKERRTDQYPDFNQMLALAQGVGQSGLGPYGRGGGGGGGSRYKNPGGKLKIRQQNFASTPEGLRAAHREQMARQASLVRNQPGSQHNPYTWERDPHTGAIRGGSRGSRPQDVPTREEAALAVGNLSQSYFGGPGGLFMGQRPGKRIGPRQQQMNPMMEMMKWMMENQNRKRNRGGGGGGGGGLNAPAAGLPPGVDPRLWGANPPLVGVRHN